MKIGIVGNREGWIYWQVQDTLKELGLYKSDVIVSGGAKGIDIMAQWIAKEIGAQLIIFYPDPKKPSPQRYFDRNKRIVLESDIVVAFDRKEHSGTLNTINYAKEIKKPLIIVRGLNQHPEYHNYEGLLNE